MNPKIHLRGYDLTIEYHEISNTIFLFSGPSPVWSYDFITFLSELGIDSKALKRILNELQECERNASPQKWMRDQGIGKW